MCELDDIEKAITENILNLVSTCRTINDLKIDIFKIMNDLIDKKLEVLKDIAHDKDAMKYFISKGFHSISKRYILQVLNLAICYECIEIVKLILSLDIDVNSKNVHGRNVLMLAVESGNMDMVKLLVNNDSDMNFRDSMGNSVLMLAVKVGNADLVQLLISKKTDTQYVNNDRENALSFAIKFANKNIINMFLKSNPEYISFMLFE